MLFQYVSLSAIYALKKKTIRKIVYSYWLGPRTTAVLFNPRIEQRVKQNSCCSRGIISLLRHSILRQSLLRHSILRQSLLRHSILRQSLLRHSILRQSLLRHLLLRQSLLRLLILRVTDSLCNSGAFNNPNAVRDCPFNLKEEAWFLSRSRKFFSYAALLFLKHFSAPQ
jgi:hypothetical protein